jgi:succinoglycan biosynthesis transport protein ExoP
VLFFTAPFVLFNQGVSKMNTNFMPIQSASKNLPEQIPTGSVATSSRSCESGKPSQYCQMGAWLSGGAFFLAMVFFMGPRQAWSDERPHKITHPEQAAQKTAQTDSASKESAEQQPAPKYIARAYLRIAFREQTLVFPSGREPSMAEYELFKNTQAQYVKNPFVLSAALRKEEINRLPILKQQDDPISWLRQNLKVSFPGHAEIMEISLAADNADEAGAIVTAVLDAYMSEVIDTERDRRRQRISELDRVYSEKETEVRNRRSELKRLAEQLGTAETETLNLKQRLTLDELASYRQELVRSQFEVNKLRQELASREAELKDVKDAEISDIECEMFAQKDLVLNNLLQEIMWLKKDKQYKSEGTTEKDKSKIAEELQVGLERLQRDYAERIAQIREEIRRKMIRDAEKKIKGLEASIEIAARQQRVTEEQMERLRKLADQFGSSSIDVEMLRNNISNLDKALNSIAAEREKLRVELRAPSRVTPLQHQAVVEKVE